MTEGIGAAEFPTAEARPAIKRQTKRQYLGAELDRLWTRGRDVLGCDLAIMGGAMTWVSERNLVAAISNTGGFGVVASGSMSPELLSAEIDATTALTRRPFGVNLITLHPQLLELIEVCAEHRVGHVVLAGGLPSSAAVHAIKRSGAAQRLINCGLICCGFSVRRWNSAWRRRSCGRKCPVLFPRRRSPSRWRGYDRS